MEARGPDLTHRKDDPMHRRPAWYLLAVSLVFSLEPLQAAGLRQRNPVAKAPAVINNDPSATTFHNEYPMFSTDGRLFLWTRQENPSPGTQWLWVAFLKNRDHVAATPAGSPMRALDFGPPGELHVVNHEFCTHKPQCKAGNPANNEIKALMLCEEGQQPTVPAAGQLRYRFTLYLAVGPTGSQRAMYRAHRVVVKVNASTGQILSNLHTSMSGGFDEVIPFATRPAGGQANETEPAMTRDGEYLFWASNAWAGGSTMAEYIGPETSCTQLMQSPKAYSNLPNSRFAWKDQYTSGSTSQRTSRTNYHAILEKYDVNDKGPTALIFEECQGQTNCLVPSDRDCVCEGQNEWLSTTGFSAGGAPTTITSLGSGPLNTTNGLGVPVRVTHPAISGRQAPPPDGRWLLFFMRGKKIWYTMISE